MGIRGFTIAPNARSCRFCCGSDWIVVAAKWLFKIALDHKTCKVAETFFTEAAVLWFVFPILDIIYEHREMSDPKLRQAYIASIVCFLAAVALSHAGREN